MVAMWQLRTFLESDSEPTVDDRTLQDGRGTDRSGRVYEVFLVVALSQTLTLVPAEGGYLAHLRGLRSICAR